MKPLDHATRKTTVRRLGSWLDQTHGPLNVCPGCQRQMGSRCVPPVLTALTPRKDSQ